MPLLVSLSTQLPAKKNDLVFPGLMLVLDPHVILVLFFGSIVTENSLRRLGGSSLLGNFEPSLFFLLFFFSSGNFFRRGRWGRTVL